MGDNTAFLFINQYSKGENETSDRPDKRAVGSHVQRNIHLRKRSKIRFEKQSHPINPLALQRRMIFPNCPETRSAHLYHGRRDKSRQNITSRNEFRSVEGLPLWTNLGIDQEKMEIHTSSSIQSTIGYDSQFSNLESYERFGPTVGVVPCRRSSQTNASTLHIENGRQFLLAARPRQSSALECMTHVSNLSLNDTQESGCILHQTTQRLDEDESNVHPSNQQMSLVQEVGEIDQPDGPVSFDLHQPVGPGSADPFNAAALPINAFHGKLISYFQRSFTFRSMERLSPKLGVNWIQALICDKATMHGLYANSLLLAARLNHGNDRSKAMSALALHHENFTIAVTRRRILQNDHSSQVALALVSLLICAYNAKDWNSYRAHLTGLEQIVRVAGGLASMDRSLQFLLLVGEPQSSSHMLTMPIFGSHDLMYCDWHEFFIPSEVKALLESRIQLPERYSLVKSALGEVWKVLVDVQEFHWVTVQCAQYVQDSTIYNGVRGWLQFRFHCLNISLIQCYCGLHPEPEVEVGGQSKLSRAFLVALLCCHQVLYHAAADPSLINMEYIPFFHITKHLAALMSCYDNNLIALKPEILDILMWISFIGAYEELSRCNEVNPNILRGPNSTIFLQIAGSRQQNGNHSQDIEGPLENFLYDRRVFGPTLYHLQCYI